MHPRPLQRRTFLSAAAVLVQASVSLGACGARRQPLPLPSRSPVTDLETVLSVPELDDMLRGAAEHLATGTTTEEFLAALHGAALRSIVPAEVFAKPHHALLVLEPLRQVVDRVVPEQGRLALLWGVHYFHWARAQAGGPVL